MLRQNMNRVGTKNRFRLCFCRLDTDRFERDTDREKVGEGCFLTPKKGPMTAQKRYKTQGKSIILHVKAIPGKELDFPKIQDGDTDRERVGNRCSENPPLGTPRERGIIIINSS